jgi:hypothetical protein
MLVETRDLLTPHHAAALLGHTVLEFVNLVDAGILQPFVEIDGLRFYHRNEVLARKRFQDTLAGRAPRRVVPKTQELF